MPSRKQRRRRAKERRHDWEEVWVDAEGHEVEPPPADADAQSRNGTRAPAPARKGRAQTGRQIQPPSWRRVAKRGLFFAPVMFLFVTLVANELTVVQRVAQTVFLLAIFLPFSYMMDALMYRIAARRGGASGRS